MKSKALVTIIATLLAISFTAFAADESRHAATPARSIRTKPRRRSRNALTHPTPTANSPRARSSATRTCTPAFSMDAGAFGCRLSPRDAYRFARGEQVMASSGQPAKLSRPLDFLVVADHSDQMGSFPDLFAGKAEILAHPMGRKWYDLIQAGKGAEAAVDIVTNFGQGTFPKELVYFPGTPAYRGAWQETIDAAEQYNEPGRFTAFIGYEWTSLSKGNNLHRNVMFRDNGDRVSQVEPFTCVPPIGSINPVDLWKWMDAYEKKTGGSVLAIAHNGNLSNGLMFPFINGRRQAIDREYAETRAECERLFETTQMKGDGEAHPFLSPNDEFAGYELGTTETSTAPRSRSRKCSSSSIPARPSKSA